VPDFTPLLWLGGFLAAWGASAAARAVGSGRPRLGAEAAPAHGGREASLLLLAWLAGPVLFFARHSTPVFPHYFILLFPAPWLLAGLGLEALVRRGAGWRLLWVVPVALAAAQVWLSLGLLRFVGTTATPGGFGVPLARLLQTAEAARRAGGEVLVVSAGSDPAVDVAPAVFDALLRDTPRRFADGRTTVVFPAGEAAVVVWPPEGEPRWPAAGLYQAWASEQAVEVIPLRHGEGAAWVVAGPGQAPAVPVPRPASALLANGVEVLGSGRDGGGWQLWWLAPGPAGDAYQVFAHLYDASGQRQAQVDQATYPGIHWRAGDLVVSRLALPEAPGVIRAGMYASPSLEPVPVLDASGEPAGPWLEFSAP
jgi:hypothetical protein